MGKNTKPIPSELPPPADTFEGLLLELTEAREVVRDVLARISELAHGQILGNDAGRTYTPPGSLGGGKAPTGIGTSPKRAPRAARTAEPLLDSPRATNARMDASACHDAVLEFVRYSDIPVPYTDLRAHGIELGHAERAVRSTVKRLVKAKTIVMVGGGRSVRYAMPGREVAP